MYTVVVLSLIISIIALYNSFQGEWVCMGNKCLKEVKGDEWVTNFCRPNVDKTDMICKFNIDNKNYEIPLSKLDSDSFKTCMEYECAVKVKVKEAK